ncbi:cysteine hydrolase family protein [Nonomuraea turcica]|uniref:hypothetical protein n=1 Tax=Nonomuraea sp. G32 TaxID=3067274 RepID=UPI00273B03FA|nr:hypothetical protein [Nonomuraea sp. G32]MDP4511522.1 hypothetical protein [Nonomuraea sp. G32]
MDKLDPRRTALILIDLMTRIVEQPTAPHAGPAVVARSWCRRSAQRRLMPAVRWRR